MIGIFDSGCGGLTVLRAIRDEMPTADILYFGDTKHAPYGGKGREELTALTIAAIERLQRSGATRIVSACNSVSACLAVSLFDTLIPEPDSLIEMAGPTIASFRGSDAHILLVATEATIRSEIYQHGFRMIGKNIDTLAIPELAGAIERGAPHHELERIIHAARDMVKDTYDALVLACTHYPHTRALFEQAFPGVTVVDPSRAVAERVKRLWWPREVGSGTLRFLVSAESPSFPAPHSLQLHAPYSPASRTPLKW